MGEVGGGDSRTSTEFRRAGTSTTRQHSNRPSWLINTNRANIEAAMPSVGVRAADDNSLLRLLTANMAGLPGMDMLKSLFNLPSGDFQGAPALESIASIDPYSDDYRNQLENFYANAFGEAAAAGRTGPEAVRGGATHGAMVESDVMQEAALGKFREITGLQLGQADMTQRAIQLLQAIEDSRRGQAVGAQSTFLEEYLRGLGLQLGGSDEVTKRLAVGTQAGAALSKEFGTEVGRTTDNLSGRGVQNSSHSNWNAGLSCCFIFLESLNGQLPWYVRRARDLLCTPQRVSGYRRMSRWVVPAMRRSCLIRSVVNAVVVRRFLSYGAWLFNAEGARWTGRLDKPICMFWFLIWDLLGRKTKEYADIR